MNATETSGPAGGFVDGGTDVLDAGMREPDHRCGTKALDATQPGDRHVCIECERVFVFVAVPFRQWLPLYESTGQRPHAHAVKRGDSDEDAIGGFSILDLIEAETILGD